MTAQQYYPFKVRLLFYFFSSLNDELIDIWRYLFIHCLNTFCSEWVAPTPTNYLIGCSHLYYDSLSLSPRPIPNHCLCCVKTWIYSDCCLNSVVELNKATCKKLTIDNGTGENMLILVCLTHPSL